MRKCKQIVSLILAMILMVTMMSVGIVQTSAADDGEDAIYTVPPSEPALLGDVNRDGVVTLLDVYVLRNSIAKRTGYLRYADYSEDSIEFKVADVFKDDEEGLPETIDLKDVYLLRSWLAHRTDAQDKGIGEPIDIPPTEPAPTEAPKPTETQAPQPTEDSSKTAAITIYGLNGQSETKEFNIGDTFKVYTSLNAADNSKIASLSASQTFTDTILSLNDVLTDEDMFVNTSEVFPVLGDDAMGRLSAPGTILYNASTPNGFVFDSDDDLAIVTEYKVTAGGTGEVRNALHTLAAADDALTRLVSKGEVASGVELTVNATFDKPAPEPTQAPETEAPKPTDPPAPTETEAPKPTDPPAPTETEAPKPTDPPAPTETEAPKPTDPPAPTETEAPKPTDPPAPTETEAPKPTVAGKATVTVIGLDGESETKEFNVGDTFTVYTTLNTANIGGGKIGSLNGTQYYTNAVLALADEYDPDEGDILDIQTMFPITKTNTVANGGLTISDEYEDMGAIYFNASTPSIRNPFFFTEDSCELIVSHYTVTAPGTAEVKMDMITLAVGDQALTRIIDKGKIVNPDFRLHSSFIEPALQPTSAPKPTDPPAPTETEAPKPTDPPAPTETEAPKPTDPPAPTETEAPKPTDPPAPTETEAPKPTVAGKAIVTVIGLDGESETKEFNVGDTFTVYTTLNTANIGGGKIGSLNGTQYYTNAVLALADEYDPDEGDILDIQTMFPITKTNTVANGGLTISDEYEDMGAIYFNASTPSIKNPFFFTDDSCELIVSHYTVTAPGTAEVKMDMITLAVGDQALTRIIDKGQIVNPDFRLHSSFIEPALQPTSAPKPTDPPAPTETEAPKPTDPPAPTETEAPKPTDPPAPTETEAPKPTDPPAPTETEAPKPTVAGKATVTVIGLDGESETKEFNVGDTFTVYTTLNTANIGGGKIGSLNGTQYYTNAVLALADEYDPDEGDILDIQTMFPITKTTTVANGGLTISDEYEDMGAIYFNASTPSIKNPFFFTDDSCELIVSHYTVTAPGTAEVKMDMITLAVGDQALTRIIDKGKIVNPDFRLHSSFVEPALQPTSAPKPTDPPAPTETETPKPTDPPVPIVEDGYYLVGTITDWAAEAAYKFTANTASSGEYMLDTTLAAGDGIKVVKVENGETTTWYPDGMDNEYVVDAAHAGNVTVYFNPTEQSAWSTFGGYFYIPSGSETDTITVHFTNSLNWSKINIYCWDEDGNEPVGEWPGTQISATTLNGSTVYTATIPANVEGIIFNDGSNQTVDITEDIADGAHWKALSSKDFAGHNEVQLVTDTPTPTTPQPTTPVSTITIYFTDALGWGSANVYCWDSDGNALMGEWSGTPMDKYEVNGYGQQVYKAVIPADVDGVIFNNDSSQTVDITDDITDGAQWYTVNTKDSAGHYEVELVGDTPDPTTPQPTTPAPTTAPATNDVVFEPGEAATGTPAWFAWVYNGSTADRWIQGTTDSSGNVTFTGAGDFGGMVIVRMPTGSTSGAWSGYWNRTGDITIQKNKTLYFTGWASNSYFNTAWK